MSSKSSSKHFYNIVINDDDDELFYSHYWYHTLQLRATTTATTRTTTQILLLIKDSKILRIVKRSFVFFVFEEVSFSLGTAVPLFDVDVPSALDEPFDDSY